MSVWLKDPVSTICKSKTRAFQHKIGQIDSPTCRFCNSAPETSARICSGCEIFNFNRYLARHDKVGRRIYWSILGRTGADRAKLWYNQQCPPFVFRAGHTVIGNQSHTRPDKRVASRPDLCWFRPDGSGRIFEVGAPRDSRAAAARNEKREKYESFLAHLKMLKKHKGKWIDFTPVIIGAAGAAPKETVIAIKRLQIEGLDIIDLQRRATPAIIRVFRTLL